MNLAEQFNYYFPPFEENLLHNAVKSINSKTDMDSANG